VTTPLALPALHASHAGSWLCGADGRIRGVGKGEAIMAAADTPHLILNAPLVATRLGYPDLSGLDLLELFAFVHPARFCVPTPKGLAHALGLEEPKGDEDVPALLRLAAGRLAETCAGDGWAEREGAWSVLQSLMRMRWPWAQIIAPHIRQPERAERMIFSKLPEWEEAPERPQPAQVVLEQGEVAARLDELTGKGAEERPGQRAYAADAAQAFAPRGRKDAPHMLLAQAGTGIGKTLGYLAPASLWAEKSGGTVWVSTFTKNLQRQLRRESRKAWPAERADGSRPVVVRKDARIISACSISKTRCRAGSAARRRCWRSWSRAGRLTARTATWSAATCRAGSGHYFAAAQSPRSPTSAANASMPAARITANASSSVPPGLRPKPIW